MTCVAFDAGDAGEASLAGLREAIAAARDEGSPVRVAFEIAKAPRRERLVRLLEGLVPREHILGYELPLDEGSRFRDAVRRHFFDALGARQVFAGPRWQDAAVPVPIPAPVRGRLALVSPFPPLKSGVAFHAADLALILQREHDVELVANQEAVADPRLAALPLRSIAWFREHADEFDDIVYQAGNSRMHEFVFDLLEEHPGIVVMHDVFLSNVLDEFELAGSRPLGLVRALYDSHGWAAIADLAAEGREPVIWKYPASRATVARASRIVVHSHHARGLVERWWGPALADRCTVVPLLRQFSQAPSRQQARARLGVADGEFLVCSFGLLGPTKCNAELLEGFLNSSLALDERCTLVFVGENVPNTYGAELTRAMATHKRAARVRVTGFASPEDYSLYLAACDVAVQLRRSSRGETSAAVLDCLGHGVPTIVNAHGSSADLPDTMLVKVPDEFTSRELAAALERLRSDDALRARIAAAGALHVRERHSPDAVLGGYEYAILRSRQSPAAAYRRFLQALTPQLAGAPDEALESVALPVSANLPNDNLPQFLVDVSAMVRTDLGTGIQRVVRELLRHWLANPPAGYRVEPVYSPGGGQPWCYARRYAAAHAGLPHLVLGDSVAELRAGDLFVGLDLHPSLIAQNEALLLDMRERGVRVAFAVYDLLPVRMPHAFPPGTAGIFESWLQTVAKVADTVVAISKASADDFAQWVSAHPPQRGTGLDVAYFQLGADLPKAASRGPGLRERRALAKATARPALLMVGTIEPRKGHAQALAAVEALWARGVDVSLVIVGKAGWMMESLVARIRSHPERNRRLFWFGHASDALLALLYEHCAALLAASEGEGFGLPLVEGAQHGLSLIARDLPVFREVAGEHAFYFDGAAPELLADAIERWLALHAQGRQPQPHGLPRFSWQQSARSFEEAALHGRTVSRWSP